MKKQHIEIAALVALLLVLVVAVMMTMGSSKKSTTAKKPTTPSAPKAGVAKKSVETGKVEVAWADATLVRQAIPTVTGGRDPFKDLLLPVSKGPGPRPTPPIPVNTNPTPPPIPSAIDTGLVPGATLPGIGEVEPIKVEPPKIVVHGIIFGSTRETTYVALSADDKPYTLLKGEKIPDAQGNLWTVTAITPTSVTLSNGTQSARFRLSGGS